MHLESLPDWKERRQQAHAIRADVIEHLDEYLEQFINNAKQNGIIIHRAKDADEAIKTIFEITQISQRHVITTIASHRPVKKFWSPNPNPWSAEEIDLNHALEAEGMKVVETDLGEYIVQLRNEKPSHIITPAVHLRRQDVGQLFHEKLGRSLHRRHPHHDQHCTKNSARQFSLMPMSASVA